MVISVLGVSRGDCPCGMPRTQRRSDLNLALQWQRFILHVHGNSHDGTVFLGGLFWKVPAFIYVRHLVVAWDMSNLRISHTTRLCLLTMRA